MTDTTPRIAAGSFSVQMEPTREGDARDGVTLGRMSLDKVFDGDLAATGQGEMLTAMTGSSGSAGCVAIERVSGTLRIEGGKHLYALAYRLP